MVTGMSITKRQWAGRIGTGKRNLMNMFRSVLPKLLSGEIGMPRRSLEIWGQHTDFFDGQAATN
jgi:hypothetical protein